MSDSEDGAATNTGVSDAFDIWREAINKSIENYRSYLTFARQHGLNTSQAERQRDAAFKAFDESQLADTDPQSTEGFGMRNALSFIHDICPDPWRAAFIEWATHSPELKQLIATAKDKPEEFSYHHFIGDVCEAFGKALDAPGVHRVKSPFYRDEAPRQVQYRTRLADGTWRDIAQEDLVALARNPNGPHIVHSANHAFLDNQKIDLDLLLKDFSALFDGSRLPVTEAAPTKDSGHLSAWNNKDALGPNDTITVFATNTPENRFLNLGQLFHRLDEVAKYKENAEDDKFLNVAPIAEDMVETLLKSIVVDEDIGKIKLDKDATGKPIFFTESIRLRDDALEIIRRQRYRSFSKGGNDFRDGMRLLVHTLDAKTKDGQSAVILPKDTSIRDLIDNMSVIVFGLNEKPMSEYYRKYGVHVPIISSKNDITAPPTVHYEANEPAYNYEGGAKRDDAGNFLDDGHSPTYSVNGMLADWRIHDLLRMHGAISQGQAAITDVNFVVTADGSYDKNRLAIEVAHGTSDAMMDRVLPAFTQALHDAGLTNVKVVRVGDGQGRERYQLQGEGMVSAENIECVQGVLRALSARHKPDKPGVKNPQPEHLGIPLWVSEATAYEKISGMKRYLVLEGKGKLDQQTPYPISVIDPASVVERARYNNLNGLRKHPRIATIPTGEQQIG